jgi:RNA-directed DNA polymerase
MQRIRARIGDIKVTRLLGQFLKAGVLADGIVLPTSHGTPQGGVISPLLANIALGVIEERYERWTHHRRKIRAHRRCDPVTAAMGARMSDRKAGRPVFFPIRYADDFIVLVAGTREQAEEEKTALAAHLDEAMGLELSVEKFPIRPRESRSLGTGCATNGIPGLALCHGSKSQTTSGRIFGTR